MKYIIVESYNGTRIAVHVVTLPGLLEPGFYQQARVMGGFSRAMHNDFMKHNRVVLPDGRIAAKAASVPGQHFWVRDEIDYQESVGDRYSALPHHYYDSVYRFFDVVCYDRGRKRLTSWPRGRNGRSRK